MGNVSVKWSNQSAQDYLSFLVALFGNPYIFDNKPGGIAVWTERSFINKTLFGQAVCFKKIIVKDESIADNPGQKNFLYIIAKAPMSSTQSCNLSQIVPGSGYDTTQKYVWVRSNNIDMAIAGLGAITDYATNKTMLNQYPTVYTSVIQSINSAASDQDRVDIIKLIYGGVCTNIAKLATSATPVATPAPVAPTTPVPPVPTTASSERMFDNPWYGGGDRDPYYSMNQPGNIALGEEEDQMYYRREQEPPLIFPSFHNMKKERMVPSPNCKGACINRYYSIIGNSENFTPSTLDISKAYGLFQPGSASAPILDTTASKNKKIIGIKKEYLKADSPMTLNQAFALFQPKRGVEQLITLIPPNAHMARFENLSDKQLYNAFQPGSVRENMTLIPPNAHMARFENLSDKQLYNAFQPGSASTNIISNTLSMSPKTTIAISAKGKKEFISSASPLTLNQAYKLLEPRFPLTKRGALNMEAMTTPITLGQAFQLFQPKQMTSIERLDSKSPSLNNLQQIFQGRGSSSIENMKPATIDLNKLPQLFQNRGLSSVEHMNTSLGVDSQVRSCQLFLNEVGKQGAPVPDKITNGRENLDESSRNPRFLPFNSLVHYQIGSDTVDIDRVYGTTAQKIKYPQYTDMLKYGCVTADCKKNGTTEHFDSFAGDEFYDTASRG
jgi:hypothetical protein